MSSWAKPVPPDTRSEDTRFAELYGRYYRSVHAYCRRRLASDAVDDAVAEVFLTAWRRLHEMPDGDSALIWLYGAAHHVIGNQWRGAARYRRLKARMRTVVDHPASAADETVVDHDACRIVHDAIARLGGTDVEVLLLSVVGAALGCRDRGRARHRPQRGRSTAASRPIQPRPRIPPTANPTDLDPRSSDRRCPVITDDEVMRVLEQANPASVDDPIPMLDIAGYRDVWMRRTPP